MQNEQNVDMSGFEPVESSVPSAPPLDPQPDRSPFYRGQVPATAIVNPDSIRNFTTTGIPQFRVVPPQPLTVAGASTNAVPAAPVVSVSIPHPPAPVISQALTTTTSGFQFTFLEVNIPTSLPAGAVIDSYKVYRSTTNSFGTATVFDTITHNPANAAGPVTVKDVQPNGTVMYYWVSTVNVSGLESTPTPAQSAPVSSGNPLNSQSQLASSTPLNNQASLVGAGVLSDFSYTSTTSSIQWSWSSFNAPRPDGSFIPVASGNQTFTSLSSASTYHFGIYILNNGSVVVVLSDTSSGLAKGSITWQVQTINADGHNVVTVDITASTTSSGTGGGSGGGNQCFSGNTRLVGGKRFEEIAATALAFTLKGVRIADLLVHDFEGEMIDMGDGELVTLNHLFYRLAQPHDRTWIPASEKFADFPRISFSGKVYNLHVRTDKDDERNYVLANGTIAHNYKLD